MQYRDIEEFELYEINEFKEIRHKVSKKIKLPHRGGTNIRLYDSSTKTELSRKIDKLFDKAFPELVEGIELPNLSKYKIRKNGDVYSKYEAKVLKPATTKKGYKQVFLTKDDGTASSCLIHQLVARAFINNVNNAEQVNHIDGDKSNNNVSNLEWCTNTENNQHAWSTGLYNSKFVGCKLSFDGINWIEFTSAIEAAEYLNCPVSTVRTCLNKNRKSKEHKYRCRGHIVLDN